MREKWEKGRTLRVTISMSWLASPTESGNFQEWTIGGSVNKESYKHAKGFKNDSPRGHRVCAFNGAPSFANRLRFALRNRDESKVVIGLMSLMS